MPEMRFTRGMMHYEVHGSGPPLLLLAGLGQSSRVWRPALKRLVGCYEVLVYDNWGTGQSSSPGSPFTVEDLAGEVATLAHRVFEQPVSAIGWSFGGSVLQAMMVDYPSVLRRAVLVSSFPSYSPLHHAWLEGLLTLRASGASPLAIATVGYLPWNYTYRSLRDHTHAMRLAYAIANEPRPMSDHDFRIQAEAVASFDVRSRLHEVQVPTLIVVGAEDNLTPTTDAEAIAEGIPQARLAVLPRGSHAMLLEFTDEVVGEIIPFLSDPAGAREQTG